MRQHLTGIIRLGVALLLLGSTITARAEQMRLSLRSIRQPDSTSDPIRVTETVAWESTRTAVIVCDVWDYHHCLNAVRRLEEFAPRLNEVLQESRKRGAVIIHAPSDCMLAYADHPARARAIAAPAAAKQPRDVEYWCSSIPKEERAAYPIDQSDGGEDDDPAEHAAWAAKLKELGRNPGTPWKKQSDLISIDAERDYISDRGDEVWNILEQHRIENVILTGVHCNMCVLGRPFGLRQMVRNRKEVVLMRDMTDSMYSPKSWPFVDHFTGHDLVIAHVEKWICPTITSDQLLGGQPFRWKSDTRTERDVMTPPKTARPGVKDFFSHWSNVRVPRPPLKNDDSFLASHVGKVTYRCAVRLPADWLQPQLAVLVAQRRRGMQVWINGHELKPVNAASKDELRFEIPTEHVAANDYNLLVVRADHQSPKDSFTVAPVILSGDRHLSLDGRWQLRAGSDPAQTNIPLPAKFGIGSDVVFEPR